jgi:hypothetical protein
MTELNQVNKRYGQFKVLFGCTAHVAAGLPPASNLKKIKR